MSEIEITLPTVQFGNVKIRGTAEEWGLDTISDAPDVGVWAATYLNLFAQGFKVGAAMDVDAHLEPSGGPSVAQAAALLNKGLGGVTELSDGTSVEAAPQGYDEVVTHEDQSVTDPGEADDAPWNSTVDAKPKPWETGKAAPAKVADIDW